MIQFDSILQAFDYMFDGKKITTLNIPGSAFPWFYVDQIREAIGYKNDNHDMVKRMDHRDEYIAVLAVSDVPEKQSGTSEGNNYTPNKYSPTIMIVSLPGIFELLRHMRASENNRVAEFWYWINNTILLQMYYNPQIVQELNRLQDETTKLKKKLDSKIMIQNVDKTRYPYCDYEAIKQYVQETKPYTVLGKAVATENDLITIDMLAHIIQSKGYPTGANRMYEELRNDGFLNKYKGLYNHPSQYVIDNGLMTWCCITDSTGTYTKVFITPKGQEFFINYYMNKLSNNQRQYSGNIN